jgi:hypothetical protein
MFRLIRGYREITILIDSIIGILAKIFKIVWAKKCFKVIGFYEIYLIFSRLKINLDFRNNAENCLRLSFILSKVV